MNVSHEDYKRICKIFSNGFYWICLYCHWAALDIDTYEMEGCTCRRCKKSCVNQTQFKELFDTRRIRIFERTGLMIW